MLRAARAVATPSLGAVRTLLHRIRLSLSPQFLQSGAILNLLAMTCIAMPDARLAIVFLPFISFSAGMVPYSQQVASKITKYMYIGTDGNSYVGRCWASSKLEAF